MSEEQISSSEETPQPPEGDLEMSYNVFQDTIDEFLSICDVDRVYGEPIERDGTTIIPAAELLSGMGFGIGFGSGGNEQPSGKGGGGGSEQRSGKGGGGGGGGRSFSRPVAVIIARPGGSVEITPVMDVTKIALAGITAMGFMLATLSRMRRPPRE